MCDGVWPADGLRGCKTQCSAGPCASFGEHCAEAIGIRVDGRPERTYRHTNFYGLSIFEEETVLGQSFLGKGLLRRFGRLEQRDDSKVRSVPGERRAASRAASIGTG